MIASAAGGLAEQVESGLNGQLFAPGDVDSLAAAMEQVIRSGASLRSNRASWPRPPSLEEHADALLKLYGAVG